MPVVKVTDSLGHTMDLYRMDSKPHYFQKADFNLEFMENMSKYSLRDDDIILCSYMKSGCHWFWEISRLLLDGKTDVSQLEKECSMMEANGVFDNIEQAPSPRILNTHLSFDLLPEDILKKGNKVIFVYRNPKDVAVSLFYHHTRLRGYNYTGTDFKSHLVRFQEGLVDNNCIFEYLRDWERVINNNPELKICVFCFEDMKENPMREVKRLSKFLEKDYSEDFLETVINATNITALRQAKTNHRKDENGSIMYRKGIVGDWKNHFTVAQNEWYDHIIRTRMSGSQMFKFRYEL